MRVKLVIAYDGAGYAGWQAQQSGVGVQQKVEEALEKVFPGTGRIFSSSRTDSGVHALGMVVHADLPKATRATPGWKLVLAVNAHLPEDIRVMEARAVKEDFHARFHASSKEYRYQVWNHRAMNPLLNGKAWHVTRGLDLRAMRAAARHLEGTHDFRSFAANRPYKVVDTVRTVMRIRVSRSGSLVTFSITGNGFLYKMCRGLVGTLVQVGLAKFVPDDMPAMLAAKDRRAAGMTAPAEGLMLWRVHYAKGGVPPPSAED